MVTFPPAFFVVTSYSCKVNTIVLLILLQLRKVNFLQTGSNRQTWGSSGRPAWLDKTKRSKHSQLCQFTTCHHTPCTAITQSTAMLTPEQSTLINTKGPVDRVQYSVCPQHLCLHDTTWHPMALQNLADTRGRKHFHVDFCGQLRQTYATVRTVQDTFNFCGCRFADHIIHALGEYDNRASVKLFELGVRIPEGLFLGVWYAVVSIFGVFVCQAFWFSAYFRPTRNDEDHSINQNYLKWPKWWKPLQGPLSEEVTVKFRRELLNVKKMYKLF